MYWSYWFWLQSLDVRITYFILIILTIDRYCFQINSLVLLRLYVLKTQWPEMPQPCSPNMVMRQGLWRLTGPEVALSRRVTGRSLQRMQRAFLCKLSSWIKRLMTETYYSVWINEVWLFAKNSCRFNINFVVYFMIHNAFQICKNSSKVM